MSNARKNLLYSRGSARRRLQETPTHMLRLNWAMHERHLLRLMAWDVMDDKPEWIAKFPSVAVGSLRPVRNAEVFPMHSRAEDRARRKWF